LLQKVIGNFFKRIRGKGVESPQLQQQQEQEERLATPASHPSSLSSFPPTIRVVRCSLEEPSREEELLAKLAEVTAERDQLASQVPRDLGAHAPQRACGTETGLDRTLGLAEDLVSQYQELVAVVDQENETLRAALTEAKEETIKAHKWAEERVARFREERKFHEENLAMAKAIIVEQEKMLKALEAELAEEKKKREEAEDARLFDGYLRDLRNGATYGETGARYYGRRRAVSK
jgi:DNA repair exonuclease SbcCD ATPase subunit